LTARRRVFVHRAATVICLLLAIPGVLWWSESVLFVILISLATQAWTSLGAAEAAEAADDAEAREQQDRIEAKLDALLGQREAPGGPTDR
jgi:hypothetical protein